MTVTAADLIGAWRLERWSLIYEDGRPDEYPLGSNAIGMIMYTANGEVSATLMRAGRAATAPVSEMDKAKAFAESFAYAGRYEVRDGTAYHSIEIATNPALIGLTSTRHIKLEGDRLTLSGPDFSAGSSRTQQIVWRRAMALESGVLV
jgi:Lipocalin-like domain